MIIKYNLRYESDKDAYYRMIKVLDIIYAWGLTEYQILLLTYYLRFGYNRECKEIILEESPVKSIDSINTQNYLLRNKGLLEDDRLNKNIKHLSSKLLNLKKFVEGKGGTKGLLIDVNEE